MLMPKLATQQLAVHTYHMTATGHSSSWQYNVITYNSAAVSQAGSWQYRADEKFLAALGPQQQHVLLDGS